VTFGNLTAGLKMTVAEFHFYNETGEASMGRPTGLLTVARCGLHKKNAIICSCRSITLLGLRSMDSLYIRNVKN
jgi:hypothetical protein